MSQRPSRLHAEETRPLPGVRTPAGSPCSTSYNHRRTCSPLTEPAESEQRAVRAEAGLAPQFVRYGVTAYRHGAKIAFPRPIVDFDGLSGLRIEVGHAPAVRGHQSRSPAAARRRPSIPRPVCRRPRPKATAAGSPHPVWPGRRPPTFRLRYFPGASALPASERLGLAPPSPANSVPRSVARRKEWPAPESRLAWSRGRSCRPG